MNSLPRKRPLLSQDEKICEIAKLLIRKTEKKLHDHESIKDLKLQLQAYKLGISPKDCNATPNIGFLEFASKPPLDRYLSEFDHVLKIADDGEIQLKQNDGYISWKDAKALTTKEAKDPARYQQWTYGENGVQNKNMFDWEKLTPYKTEDPKRWDCKYILELCCCCEDKPRFIGDHTWIRLKTPEGEIYSVGLYRPYKTKNSSKKDPLRIQKGILMQPDVSEFWPVAIHRIPFEITSDQFLKIKNQIESDKQNDNEILEAFGRNCTQYAEKIALMANIQLPLEKSMWRLLCHKYGNIRVIQAVDRIKPKIPEKISSLIAKNTSFWCSFALSCFGASKVDPEVAETTTAPVTPKFKSFRDLFNPENCKVKHPHTLGHETKHLVETKREKLIKACLEKKKEIQLHNVRNLSNNEKDKELELIDQELNRLKYA